MVLRRAHPDRNGYIKGLEWLLQTSNAQSAGS